jgi:protein-disulfide isomerase
MSRKSRRNRPDAGSPNDQEASAADAQRNSRRGLVAVVVVVLLVGVLAVLALRKHSTPADGAGADARNAALASEHSPTLGEATARVHVVEFLDPACETCAQFFPVVKQLMAANPGRIRLSLRHVAFHEGADYAVRMLEASRNQEKYWETLEALLQSQPQWAPHHTVQPDRVLAAVAGVGLDPQRLAADMDSAAVAERIARDRDDAVTLKVTATPEYFVNGRPLPEFGYEPLVQLVQDELARSY